MISQFICMVSLLVILRASHARRLSLDFAHSALSPWFAPPSSLPNFAKTEKQKRSFGRRSAIRMMPEGPEVMTIQQALSREVVGKTLTGISFLSGRYITHGAPKHYEDFVTSLPAEVTDWKCKGKFQYFVLNTTDHRSCWITLGMSGRFHFADHSGNLEKHARVVFHLVDSLRMSHIDLVFVDARNFGTIHFCLEQQDLISKLNGLGPSILDRQDELTLVRFLQICSYNKNPSMNICKFLMNQKKISGVGNYILSEALYKSRTDPFVMVGELSDERKAKLLEKIKETAQESLAAQGHTRTKGGSFRSVTGDMGGFALEVYGKTKCPLGYDVVRTEGPHGRSLWYVPELIESSAGSSKLRQQGKNDVVDDIASAMRSSADPDNVPKMEQYMRNKFKFLGVPAPARKKAVASFLRGPGALSRLPTNEVVSIVDDLWALPEREFQYIGCDILRGHARYSDAEELLKALRRWLEEKPWWDTVDMLAMVVCDIVALPHVLPQMDLWIRDSCFWVRRCALICQIKRREETDTKRLFDYCDLCSQDKEVFIAKAVGWALRSYAKVDAQAVKEFAELVPLQPLSKREALKNCK